MQAGQSTSKPLMRAAQGRLARSRAAKTAKAAILVRIGQQRAVADLHIV